MWKKVERPVRGEKKAINFPKSHSGGKVDNAEIFFAFHRAVEGFTWKVEKSVKNQGEIFKRFSHVFNGFSHHFTRVLNRLLFLYITDDIGHHSTQGRVGLHLFGDFFEGIDDRGVILISKILADRLCG